MEEREFRVINCYICQQTYDMCGQHVSLNIYNFRDVDGDKTWFWYYIRPIDNNDYTKKRMKYDEFRSYIVMYTNIIIIRMNQFRTKEWQIKNITKE